MAVVVVSVVVMVVRVGMRGGLQSGVFLELRDAALVSCSGV